MWSTNSTFKFNYCTDKMQQQICGSKNVEILVILQTSYLLFSLYSSLTFLSRLIRWHAPLTRRLDCVWLLKYHIRNVSISMLAWDDIRLCAGANNSESI